MKNEEIPLIAVKIERDEDEEEEEFISDEESVKPNPAREELRQLVKQYDTIQKAKRLSDPDVEPVTLGYVQCPTCGYECEGLFQNDTHYPDDTAADDVCEHLLYVKKDVAYFVKSN